VHPCALHSKQCRYRNHLRNRFRRAHCDQVGVSLYSAGWAAQQLVEAVEVDEVIPKDCQGRVAALYWPAYPKSPNLARYRSTTCACFLESVVGEPAHRCSSLAQGARHVIEQAKASRSQTSLRTIVWRARTIHHQTPNRVLVKVVQPKLLVEAAAQGEPQLVADVVPVVCSRSAMAEGTSFLDWCWRHRSFCFNLLATIPNQSIASDEDA